MRLEGSSAGIHNASARGAGRSLLSSFLVWICRDEPITSQRHVVGCKAFASPVDAQPVRVWCALVIPDVVHKRRLGGMHGAALAASILQHAWRRRTTHGTAESQIAAALSGRALRDHVAPRREDAPCDGAREEPKHVGHEISVRRVPACTRGNLRVSCRLATQRKGGERVGTGRWRLWVWRGHPIRWTHHVRVRLYTHHGPKGTW